jgi:hypothetical protein
LKFTGIHALDKVARDLGKVRFEISAGVLPNQSGIIYFPRGNGKSVIYEFAVALDRLDTVDRVMRVMSTRKPDVWKTLSECVQRKCYHGKDTYMWAARLVRNAWREMAGAVVSSDGNVLYLGNARNCSVAIERLGASVNMIEGFNDELFRNCSDDKKFWGAFSAYMQGWLPHGA